MPQLQIDWILDEEDEPLDASSLLGRLVITDGTESIDEPSVYVDSWFASLIRASQAASRETAEIEIQEHPQRLIVCCDEKDRLHLAFRNSEVIASSPEQFRRVLKQRAETFSIRWHQFQENRTVNRKTFGLS